MTASVKPYLFDAMDPVAIGLIKPGEKLAVPVIRIVFALGSETCAIRHVQTQKQDDFTSYDIWLSGISSEVFGVVDQDDQSTWNSLLAASRGWEKMFSHRDPCTDSTTEAALKSVTPLITNDEAFRTFAKQTASDSSRSFLNSNGVVSCLAVQSQSIALFSIIHFIN